MEGGKERARIGGRIVSCFFDVFVVIVCANVIFIDCTSIYNASSIVSLKLRSLFCKKHDSVAAIVRTYICSHALI